MHDLDREMQRPSMPRLNILLMTVGTRGDVQPFLALAHALSSVGHRCRLATHSAFEDWVVDKAKGCLDALMLGCGGNLFWDIGVYVFF